MGERRMSSRLRKKMTGLGATGLGVAGLGATAVLALLFANSTPAQAIADGVPAAEGQYRFATKLTMTDIPKPDGTTYDSGCTAALIAPQWIISAGHCFHDVNRNPV